jgi:hypothetical protein
MSNSSSLGDINSLFVIQTQSCELHPVRIGSSHLPADTLYASCHVVQHLLTVVPDEPVQHRES